jgi:hypothetical protein
MDSYNEATDRQPSHLKSDPHIWDWDSLW